MEVSVASKRKKTSHGILMDEEDGRELERILTPKGETEGPVAKLGPLPPYEVQKKTLKDGSSKFILKGNHGELYLARWVAERAAGRELEPGENVTHVDGDCHNMRRQNLQISPPKGLRKGTEVAWIVRNRNRNYVCVKKENGEKEYILCKERDPEEVRREWFLK